MLSQILPAAECRAITSILVAEDFTQLENQQFYTIIVKLVADNLEVSPPNVYTYAQKAGMQVNMARYITSGKYGDTIVMAVLLHEMGVKRRLADALSEVVLQLDSAEFGSTDAVSAVNAAMAEAGRNSARRMVDWKGLHGQCVEVMRKKAAGEIPLGIATGYHLIDNAGGLEEGSLIIIAGRTSNGKTAFALNLAMNVALNYVPVVMYSLEMTNEQVGNRMLAALTNISASAIKKGELLPEQWGEADKAGYDIPLFFDDEGIASKQELYSSIRSMVDTKQVRVVVIDYLQLIKVGKGDMRIEIGKIANELKVLAKQLKITIVLLSQLSREAKGMQPVPRINELKESGEIENAADAIYFVYRPEQHSPTLAFPDMSAEWSKYSTKGTALLICAKNRLERTGEQLLAFSADTMRFWQNSIYEPAGSRHKGFEPI